ncbi:MAG: GatB/YqeY domain-containing protein [Candidatus Omnitrophica bacterium]|nr:GatB/YqeY domain-containing protein [Candidatus Omnitrophota bacterium]
MATISERLDEDYKTALKAGQRRRVETIRMAKAAIQRAAIDKRKDALDDQEALQVLAQQAKLRRETIESAKQVGRPDVVQEATEELTILGAYLPAPLTPEAINGLIEEALKTVGANQGQIMKFVMGKAGAGIDGKQVSQLVGQRLKHP